MTIDLYLGDCYPILPPLVGVDAIITDPPYGNKKYATDIEFESNLLAAWRETYRTVAVFGYPELLVRWCVRAAVTPDEWVTWWPTNKFSARAKLLPKSSECVAVFGEVVGAQRIMRPRVQTAFTVALAIQRGLDPNKAREGDVWRDAAPGISCNRHLRQHPNEKPITLMERLVELCSNPGDTVLDPFMGSGTTGVACARLGRNFIGIEKEPKYFDIAQRRIADAQAQLALPV